jgi:hypothetical protein
LVPSPTRVTMVFIKLGRKTGTLQGSGCKPVALAMVLDVFLSDVLAKIAGNSLL